MLSNIKLTFFVAWRYLFSKKSRNVINIISLISAIGIVISTAALVCVLSVFNGFVGIIEDSYSAFDSELQITAATGKVFDFTDVSHKVKTVDNIAAVSYVLEDDALIAYYNSQTPFRMRGVDAAYSKVLDMDSMMMEGQFRLYDFDFDVSVVGIGLASKLNLGVDYVNGLTIYVPQRQGKINIARPDAAFRKGELFVCGIFASHQPEIDDNMLIVPLEFAQKMYDYDSLTVSSVELKLRNIEQLKKTEREVQNLLGDRYKVQNRGEQQADYLRIINIERMLIFVILAFMVLIATCNIIGSLSMLLIEKDNDIGTLDSLGMRGSSVSRIFVVEGWLLSVIGVVAGLVVGVVMCLLQARFGFIKMGDNSYIENYPVVIEVLDILAILAMVLLIGFITSFITVKIYFANKNNEE